MHAELQNSSIIFKPINPGVPEFLVGDSIRFKQILINLVKNALQYSHNNQIILKAGFHYQANRLDVKICGKGRGIQQDERANLFRSYHPNDNIVSNGMVFCKKVTEKLGGKLEIKSKGADKGTTFSFSLNMTLPEGIVLNTVEPASVLLMEIPEET